jgi:hypothetical protein
MKGGGVGREIAEISSRVPGSTISGFKRKTHKNLDKGGNYEKYFSKRLFSPIVRLYPPKNNVQKTPHHEAQTF